ncbi:uncharacterized protein PITG_13715 [Phytophthora infestans T30-4]|uniref:Transmembrane protein, putative n=1 Tax=Phytophthora infestans (strain T30-4) TaxID=403677 RepID=D0NML8_PHYIT|nr:uncharacterized protein PITG_13715 [Phytophthora infestans T30-4]EEY61775.1 transmembrane protein, putative [Phytophthora infestans T30-4]|eukprot:XP_002899415.1 transmembrane protein, putative [Phytophthora infestans T30-4]
MPPPSPTRDGPKKQSVECEASKVKSPEPRQRRRSMEAVPMEPQETMAATYTKKYLQRRRSQVDEAHKEQQRRSSGCRRMERRCSSSDAEFFTEPLKDNESLPPVEKQQENNCHEENGHHHSGDTTVATDLAATGKGVQTENDGHFAMIVRDQSVKVTMTKKRKAPCGRSTLALAVVAGVVTVTVGGGIAICRMYPSSPAAISIRFVATKTEEILTRLLKTLTHGTAWTQSALDWTGLKSHMSDVSLSSHKFLAPLETTQAAIQSIARELTTQESQALQDVKRLENYRLTIASDTNAILAETRDFALESIGKVKMAALEAIERRLKLLEERYARSFDQALKEYERTSQQVEKEGGAEITVESQAQVDAAMAMKRALTADDGKPAEVPVADDYELSSDGLRDDVATGGIELGDVEAEELAEASVVAEQGAAEESDKEEVVIAPELLKEGLMTINHAEEPAQEQSFEVLETEDAIEELAQISAELTDQDAKLSTSVDEMLRLSMSASKDQGDGVVKIAKENVVTNELESVDKQVEGKLEETLFTEVVVDVDSTLLEIERTQVELTELLEAQNLSTVDASRQEGDGLHLNVRADETDLEHDVEADSAAAKGTAERAFAAVKTRMATQPGPEMEGGVDEEKTTIELMLTEEHAEEHSDVLTDDTEMEVRTEEIKAEVVLSVERESENDAVATGKETEERDVDAVDDAPSGEQPKKDVHVAISNEIEALETVVAKELEELEQLEQVLLQTEGVRVEEELRAIAKEEASWLQSEEAAPQQDSLSDQRTATIDTNAPADVKSEGPPASTSPLMQICLLSLVFLGFAALAAYLLIRYHKPKVVARSPRRKRWQRLADLDDSDTEEVVLMQDSSDEEDAEGASKEPPEEVELTSSVELKATTIEASDEEVDDGEETVETHEIVEEHEELVEDEAESKATRTVVVESVQTTYTADHPASSSSDTSADDSSASTANTSVSTPPKDTPDTSRRPRRSRRHTHM